jgi:two-component system, NarL family, nitrate/nitrite response regulator NarL
VPKKKVLLVDDNATVRTAVRPLFDSHPRFVVCGEAEHGRDAIEKAPILRPDLIVIDMSMPVMNGLEAAPLLIKILPSVWLILVTTHDFPELYPLARSAGIHAVVPKSKAVTHLIAQAEDLFGMTPVARGA